MSPLLRLYSVVGGFEVEGPFRLVLLGDSNSLARLKTPCEDILFRGDKGKIQASVRLWLLSWVYLGFASVSFFSYGRDRAPKRDISDSGVLMPSQPGFSSSMSL